MSCESIRAELVAYLQDELAAPRRAEVQQHLSGCRECTAELDGYRTTQKAVSGLRVGEVSGDFEKKVRERISAKVAELRSKGSPRFRTGRERNEEAGKWPGLWPWLAGKRRAVLLFLLCSVPVVAIFWAVYAFVVKPFFSEVAAEKKQNSYILEDFLPDSRYRMRTAAAADASRRNVKISADGVMGSAEFLGTEPLRLVPVIEPAAGGHPTGACIYVYTPSQWQSLLDEEPRVRTMPVYPAWKRMVDTAFEVRPDGGSLRLPPGCLRDIGAPARVSVLRIGDKRYEIWEGATLEEYLTTDPRRPGVKLAPAKPRAGGAEAR